MAIAIGLFAVFPLTYVLNASLASTYASSLNGSVSSFINSEIGSNNNIVNAAVQTAGNSKSNAGVISYFTGAINGLVQGFGAFINQLADFLAFIIIEVFFLPAFSIILTVISIRELARVLGSEITFGRLYIF